MSSATLGPLSLLSETWPLRELLILNYNANLGFFEQAGLGQARARGARVTLISDFDMVVSDPEATRFAGRSYLDARAICHKGGAFHPKLLVALGSDQAAVLIGSGNTSSGGWISNAEIWTLLRANAEAAPSTLVRVADFLEALEELVRFTAGVHEVIAEVARGLRAFPITDEGPQMVSSAFGPIIDQLPRDSGVEQLMLSAPFFDRNANAVRELLDRFAPKHLEVVVGKEANYEGTTLGPLIEKWQGRVSEITSPRFHHGKVVEWVVGSTRRALTGSPNLSGRALLQSMADGGSCELGLVAETATSLMPDAGEPLVVGEVANHGWSSILQTTDVLPVLLLDAAIEDGGFRLDLRSALSAAADLQLFDGSHWITIARVPAHEANPFIALSLEGGKQVRLLLADGTPSAGRSVTDLARTNHRPVSVKRSIPSQPSEIAHDSRFVALVEAALGEIRAFGAESSGTRPPGVSTMKSSPAPASWREYIDGFRGEVGDGFGFFILPAAMKAAGVGATAGNLVEADMVEVGADDSVDEEDLVGAEVTVRLDGSSSARDGRAKFRSMVIGLLDLSPTRPDAAQIATAVLAASGAALGCWSKGPELSRVLRRSLEPLLRGEVHDGLLRDAASVTSVSLALMRSQVRSFSSSSEALTLYHRTAEEAGPLLTFCEREDVEYRCAALAAEGLVLLADVDYVMHVTEMTLEANPFARVVEELAEGEVTAQADGRIIRITGLVSDAKSAVLKAIASGQEFSPIAAVARDDGHVVAGVWMPPLLYVAERGSAARWVACYPLPASGPQGYLVSRFEQASPPGTKKLPGSLNEAFVREVFGSLGLSLDEV